jgi:uncharacterized protein (DUF4415 family)
LLSNGCRGIVRYLSDTAATRRTSILEDAMPNDRNRRTGDPRKTAEAAFKAATTKAPEGPPKTAVLPGAKEMVSLRVDKDVLEHFQADGPGWQDRINAALRKAVGLA